MSFTGTLLLDLLGVITAVLAVGYAYLKWTYQYWNRKGVPYLEPPSLFGTSQNPLKKQVSFSTAIVAAYKTAKAKGWRHVGIYALARPMYMPLDLEIIKHIMTKDFAHFVDRGIYYNEKDDPLSAHLFSLGGNKWRNLRVKLTPTFTSGKLKAMFQTLVDCGLVMEKYIKENTTNTEPVDIKNILGNFSTDIIGSCAFGIECNSFKDPDSPFRLYTKKYFTRDRFTAFKSTIANNTPTLGRALRIRSTDRELSDFYTKVVEDTVRHRLENNYRRKDLLQLLIDLKSEKNGQDGYVGDGNSLTMNEIIAQCFVFFLAGFETSSTTMTFALFELARHQDLQEKVREELKTILAKHDHQVTYDSLNELKYMKQVIDETLRMYPPVTILLRQCVKDFKVPGEDVVIEKGIRVFIPALALHNDESYFENPEVFDPDRFSDENRRNIPQFAYLPFGEGPRNCIGERFGVMQTKVGLACILKNFRVFLNDKTQLPIKMNPKKIIPEVQGGIWLTLKKLDSKI